ncbi:MAG: HoxN/HupN/NixA family nickel/cobalt transporter [Chloroflexi bacterium]|nr:HoxN/HupN/NixA family nickel/cobalt transporter [Chloroflexota bacterium]
MLRGFDQAERTRLAGCYGIIALIHLVGWGLLLWHSAGNPALLGLGVLAYSFGLRHAFDADHIAAIDNTTRKLLQNGKSPVGVGFFFSLGHSTVVLIIALALGLAVRSIVESVVSQEGELRDIGGLIGGSVSGGFLVAIGILNLVIFLELLSAYRGTRAGRNDGEALESHLATGGVMTRAFGRLLGFVSESWHIYPIGFLFGLGFDTVSEIALLAISAGAASEGMPIFAVLALPLVFAGGMSLLDTTDGAFMCKAYSWAFTHPTRKLFYNLTMTGLSVLIALFVGIVELLQVLGERAGLEGGFWEFIAGVDLGAFGYVIVAGFVMAWLLALAVLRRTRNEDLAPETVES